MNFSLILNTRKRTKLLDNLLKNIKEKSNDIFNIEVNFWVDKDDADTISYLDAGFREIGLEKFKAFIGDRPTNLHTSLNYLAKQSTGKYIFVLNDDVEILTPSWDKIALEKIQEFKTLNKIEDDVLYGLTYDTSVDKMGQYASFPIISKEAVDLLGFFMYEDFVGLGGDSSIYRVYQALGRIVDCKIALDHIYHSSLYRVTNPDGVAQEMRANTAKNFVDPFKFDISKEVEKLRKVIDARGKL